MVTLANNATVSLLYVGNFPRLDTTVGQYTGNNVMENASALVGQTVAEGDGHGMTVRTLAIGFDGAPGDNIHATNDSAPYQNETQIDDTGAILGVDAYVIYSVKVTYLDSGVPTTKTVNLAALQMTNGDVYLQPSIEWGTQNALDNLGHITSVQFISVVQSSGDDNLFYSNSSISNSYVPDGKVDGTSGNDSIGAAYVDAHGDQIDNSDAGNGYGTTGSNEDHVLALAGNDSVDAGSADDTVYGGSGNDLVYGGSSGNDLLHGDVGIDSLYGGSEDDALYGGDDEDSLEGGDGNDSLSGDFGADVVFGGAGSDALVGGDGNDSLMGGDGADTLSGNAGDDTGFGGAGDDHIFGQAGNDSMNGEDGNDTLDGSDGNDTLYGGANEDSIMGGNDADALSGDAGNDTLAGDEGNDILYAGTDNDSLTGGSGNDQLFGDDGDDILTGDLGLDTIFGGAGQDHIFATAGDSIFGGEGNIDADVLHVAVPHRIVYGGGNNESGTVEFLSAPHGTVIGTASFFEIESVVCFAGGTQILTNHGPVAVEDLSHGDLVLTADSGCRPISWIGRRRLGWADLDRNPALRPIRIAAGALGNGLPDLDLIVSPQHRIMVRSRLAIRMFDCQEVLLAAKHLVGLPGIEVAGDLSQVTYWHFLFDRHEIVFANGAATESLFTGPEALKAMSAEQRKEILTLFPELAEQRMGTSGNRFLPARPIIPGRPARSFARRVAAGRRAVVE
jgi:Ca2+-binding RTX toxin-like protein